MHERKNLDFPMYEVEAPVYATHTQEIATSGAELSARRTEMLSLSKPKEVDWSLLTILFVGMIARFWGIDFCLPYKECRPDETAIVSHALKFFLGDLNPHFFSYPTLYIYVLFGFYLVYFALGRSFGQYTSTPEPLHEFALNSASLYLIDRSISAVLGTATILIVYKLAEYLFDRKTAIVSSLFLSLCYLHARDSHFGVTDVALTFFVVLSISLIVRIYKEKSLNLYAMSGIVVGIATSIKYPGFLLILPMSIAHLLTVLDERRRQESNYDKAPISADQFLLFTKYLLITFGIILILTGMVLSPDLVERYLTADGKLNNLSQLEKLRGLSAFFGCCFVALAVSLTRFEVLSDLLDKRIFIFISSFISAFLLGTPFALLDFRHFVSDFLSTYSSVNGVGGLNLGMGWWYHLRFTLPLGLGWTLCFAALIGVLVLIKSNLRQSAILFAFPLIYYLIFGKGYTVMARYMVPIAPLICIVAAVGVVFTSNKLISFLRLQSFKAVVLLALATLVIFQSAQALIQVDRLLAAKDNRLIAADWINQNALQNSSVYQTGSIYGHLELDKSPEYLARKLDLIGEAHLSAAQLDYSKDKTVKTYQEWDYDEQLKQFTFEGQKQTELPRYIIRQESPLLLFSAVESQIAEILDNTYMLKASFQAIAMGNPENWFNQQDAFYLPFDGFRGIQRAGPNLYVYEKRN